MKTRYNAEDINETEGLLPTAAAEPTARAETKLRSGGDLGLGEKGN